MFSASIALFNALISAKELEEKGVDTLVQGITQTELIPKMLLKSEEGSRVTSKIHEALMDFSFHPVIGEKLVSSYLIERIQNLSVSAESNVKGL